MELSRNDLFSLKVRYIWSKLWYIKVHCEENGGGTLDRGLDVCLCVCRDEDVGKGWNAI